MKKLMLGTLSLVCMFAIAGGGATPTAEAAPTAPEFGGCRFYCGSKSFVTEAECTKVCSTECDLIC